MTNGDVWEPSSRPVHPARWPGSQLSSVKPRAPTPLQRRLRRPTKTLGLAAVAIAAGVFVLTLVRLGTGEDQVRQAFLSAVALGSQPSRKAPGGGDRCTALGVRRMAERGHRPVRPRRDPGFVDGDPDGQDRDAHREPDAGGIASSTGEGPTRRRGVRAGTLADRDRSLDGRDARPPTGDPLEVAPWNRWGRRFAVSVTGSGVSARSRSMRVGAERSR